MSPRKSNSDMIAALEQKLAEAKAKEIEKSRTRAAYLVESIKAIDERIAKADSRFDEAVATATTVRDNAIAKLEAKRIDLDAELAELAVDTATTDQLSFTTTEAEEV